MVMFTYYNCKQLAQSSIVVLLCIKLNVNIYSNITFTDLLEVVV